MVVSLRGQPRSIEGIQLGTTMDKFLVIELTNAQQQLNDNVPNKKMGYIDGFVAILMVSLGWYHFT